MTKRALLPLLCMLLWGFYALSRSVEEFSSPEQMRYYLGVPVLLTCISLALVLLSNAKYAKTATQILSVLMLLAWLPYMAFGTGGV